MKFHVAHTTRYEYDAPLLGECFMEARLRPLTVPGEQVCRDYTIIVDPPTPVFGFDQLHQMGLVNHFVLRGNPQKSLSIHAESVVETWIENPFNGLNLLAEDWPLLAERTLYEQFAEYLAPTALVPLFGPWDGPLPLPSVLNYGQALSEEINTQFEYVPGSTNITTSLAEFVAQRRGVCQDYAHLMLSAARSRGVPARYVSGYIYASQGDGTHGAGATHAWVELYLPEEKIWKGFDPTNNVLVADHHIKVGVGRDYTDVPPTQGIVRGIIGDPLPNATGLEVTVLVEKVE
jgi:transglutaminase-like putative cysteine protease